MMSNRTASNARSSRRLAGRPARALARAAVDACEPRRLLASVSGTVFNDDDRDGVRDAGEAGRAGITVFADKNYDGVMQSTELRAVTDASGFYRITGIVADNTSTGVRLSGVAASAITAPSGGGHSARFGSDYEAANRNFGIGYTGPTEGFGAVAGRVVVDSDKDGLADDGEPGIANARVYADDNRNGVFDAGESSTLTNASGSYALGLPTTEDGVPYEIGALLAGSGLDPSAYNQPGTQDVSIRNGETYNGIGFAFAPKATPAPSATVAGTVYTDSDRDGVLDTGEAGVAGVTVYADLNYDGTRQSAEPLTTTDAGGGYSLGVPAADRSIAIRALAPAGRTFTVPSNGAQSGRYSAAITYAGRNFGLAPETTPPPNGFIILRPLYDTNNDGNPSEDDAGPSDLIVWLDSNGNGLRDGAEPLLTVTGRDDASNAYNYYLGGLTPGTYRFAIRLPGDVDSYADYSDGIALGTYYYSIPTTSSLGGLVYNDADGDGTKDAGEAGTGGVVVFADYDFDGVRDSNEPQTTTLANGTYKLYGIRSDNNPFRITALVPGATFTQPAAGYYQARFDRAYDLAAQGGRDFGYRTASAGTGTAGGRVFVDANGNGSLDAGEAALAGIQVYADLDGNGQRGYVNATDYEPAATTDANGLYSLTTAYGSFVVRITGNGLEPGTYVMSAARGRAVTLNAPAVSNANVALVRAATIATAARLDLNANGVLDENDLFQRGGDLFVDVNNNGVLDRGEDYNPFGNGPLAADADAAFALPVGTWTIGFADRDTFGYGAPAIATRTATVTAAQLGRVTFAGVPVAATKPGVTGRVYRDVNEDGVFQPSEDQLEWEYNITFGVYADLNNNGQYESGEPLAVTGGKTATGTIRAVSGSYYLPLPGNGTYTIRAYYYDPTNLFEGTRPGSHTVTVGGTQTILNRDFGVPPQRQVATLAGTVFNDGNRNGVRDAGEAGLAGRTIFADYDYDGVLDGDEPSAVTNSTGAYYLTRVRADGSSVPVRLLGVSGGSVTSPAGGVQFARYSPATQRTLNFGVIV